MIKYKIKSILPIILFVILPIIIGVWVEIKNHIRESNIETNTGKTKGVIIEIKNGKSPWIAWRYCIKNKCYEGSALDTREFNFLKFCENSSCLGDSVLVEYNTKNPEESRIVFHGMKSFR